MARNSALTQIALVAGRQAPEPSYPSATHQKYATCTGGLVSLSEGICVILDIFWAFNYFITVASYLIYFRQKNWLSETFDKKCHHPLANQVDLGFIGMTGVGGESLTAAQPVL
jgi:hypothetical protein